MAKIHSEIHCSVCQTAYSEWHLGDLCVMTDPYGYGSEPCSGEVVKCGTDEDIICLNIRRLNWPKS